MHAVSVVQWAGHINQKAAVMPEQSSKDTLQIRVSTLGLLVQMMVVDQSHLHSKSTRYKETASILSLLVQGVQSAASVEPGL